MPLEIPAKQDSNPTFGAHLLKSLDAARKRLVEIIKISGFSMNTSACSPIAPRRIEGVLKAGTGEGQERFMDTVDENLAREVVVCTKHNPEDATGTPIVAKDGCDPGTNHSISFVASASFPPLQISSLESASPSRRLFTNNKKIVSPFRSSVQKMTLGRDGEPTRSALTPRTDTQAVNGGANGLVLDNHGTMKEPMLNTTTPQAEGPRRSIRGPSSTPPRPGPTPNQMAANATRSFDTDRNRIPKNPRDKSAAAPKIRMPSGNASQKSARSAPSTMPPQPDWQWDPESQEQALFEQRLCEDAYGVAVRKINQNGKAQLRYVKCIPLHSSEDENASSTKSVTSLVRSFSRLSKEKRSNNDDASDTDKLLSSTDVRRKALIWGKKKDHKLAIDKFLAVRVGKTTDRTRKNPQPACRLLSIITNDKEGSLDIEAPTRLDRDKFARAFARFLRVPLESEDGELVGPGKCRKSVWLSHHC